MTTRIERGPGGRLDGSQGITGIELDGLLLKIEGWYDSGPSWDAQIELTDDERRQLADALRG